MWPSLVEFSEAIQNPSICFPDANLKSGTIAIDRLGMPLVSSGQFAGVFKLKSSNCNHAIRCFTRELGDRVARYHAIDSHLDKCQNISGISCLARFDYDPDGILIKGKKYPILVMEWIEGNTLDVYVEQVIGNKETLLYLANEFVRLIKTLKEAQIAHGDLQHGNIIVQSDLHLRLVDFDGMYVPGMNGMKACELGHIDYQHPTRDINYFNCNLDNFSIITIYFSLLALAYQPSLWKQFHGEGILLKNRDFKAPRNSPFFNSINGQNPELRRLLDVFRESCEKSLDRVPSLMDLVTAEERKHLPAWMIAPAGATIETKTREVKPEEIQPAVSRTHQPVDYRSQHGTITQPPKSPSTTPSTSYSFNFSQFFSTLFGLFFPWLIVSAWGSFNSVWTIFCAIICIIIAFNTAKKPKTIPSASTSTGGGTIFGPSSRYPGTSTPYPTGGYPTTGQATFIGSNIRFIYHKPYCKWALKISRRNRVSFASAAEAQRLGYRPCRVCYP